jgi:tetratricopeptide (TPR) repeat protein
MTKVILFLLLFSVVYLQASKLPINKGIKFCEKGEIDSALYYFNIVGEEITIETTEEDIFNKYYYSAKCYDELGANKSAEFYYIKAVRMMDTIEINEPNLYKDLAYFFEEVKNYKGANEYLRLYYDESMKMMNEENNIANEKLERLDSLEARLETVDGNKLKTDDDLRLLTVLIVVFASGFLVMLFLFFRQKKTLANS